jgi:hypothetical protein
VQSTGIASVFVLLNQQAGVAGRRAALNLPERRLVNSHTTVIIPLDNRVIVVGSLDCAKFSVRRSEVAQTFDAISGIKFLSGGSGLDERRPFGSICVGSCSGM